MDDDDFMSDKYLLSSTSTTTSASYRDRRRRLEHEHRHGSQTLSGSGSVQGRARQSREAALQRDLLDARTGDDGDHPPASKAVEMMLKMGYKRGEALGRGAGQRDGLREPLQVKIRQGRRGLGGEVKGEGGAASGEQEAKETTTRDTATPTSTATATSTSAFLDFRRRQFQEKRDLAHLRHVQGILTNLGADLPDKREETPSFEPFDELGVVVEKVAQEVQDDDGPNDAPSETVVSGDEPAAAAAVAAALARALDLLRETYHFCYWCGCHYASAQELEAACPGREEEDH